MRSGGGHAVWKRRKLTVEECLRVSIIPFARGGLLLPGASGQLTWTDPRTAQRTARANFRFECTPDGGLLLRLVYNATSHAHSHAVDLPIPLTRTFPNFGGIRWWFTCPAVLDGMRCGRRVGTLYLPPDAKHFGCRICHNLTYRSRQRSRR